MRSQRSSLLPKRARAVLAVVLSMLGALCPFAAAPAFAQDTAPQPPAAPAPVAIPEPTPTVTLPDPATGPQPAAAAPETSEAAAQAPAPRSRLGSSTQPSSAEKSPLSAPADPKRVYRMHAWLKHMSSAGLTSRLVDGIGTGVLGAIYGVAGAVVLGASSETQSARAGRNLVAASLLGVGAGYFYAALTNMSPTTDELRFERWRLAAGNIDEVTLARFESELATEARLASWFQLRSAGTSIGAGTVGALLIAFSAASDLDRGDRTVLYVIGGMMFGAGALTAVLTLLVEPPNVRAYRLYSEGKDPDGDDKPARARKQDQKKINVDPVVSTREAGLMISGRF